MPIRIQRKRTRGWRMPAGAVYVGRPTKFGNHWTLKAYFDAGYKSSEEEAAKVCVEAFRAWLEGRHHWGHPIPLPPVPDLEELRGKDLACWCKPGAWCHADILLELANE